MTKTSIRKALQRAAGGAEFVTTGDIKRCMGCGNDRVAEIIKGLPCIKFNRTRQYDADEVAARIYESMELN